MHKKNIDGKYVKKTHVKYSSVWKRIEGQYKGYSSLITFLKGNQKFAVNVNGVEICIVDGGYKWLAYLPDDKNWCMTAMYNQAGDIVEWYFDVTKCNFVDENGEPCMEDLYLDVVLLPTGKSYTLNEDELEVAPQNGEITREDY